MKKNFLLFSFIATLIASPAYSVTVTKTYVDSSDKTLQKNMVLLRDMLNKKGTDGNWIALDTEAQLAIPAINELHTEMAGKQDLISAENPLAVENVSGLADVAKTGSYNDLSDTPTIPSIEGLVTDEDFQDALATKQSKLTTGSGITIEETTADDGTVTTTISADVNLEDVVGEITDAQGNTITIQQALESKADASTVDTLEGLVGDTSVAEQITDKVGTIADGKTVAEVLDTKADASAVEALGEKVGEKSVAQQITEKVGEIDGTVVAALDTKLTAKSITGDGVSYDELTSVYTITDENTTYSGTGNVEINAQNQISVKTAAVAQGATTLVSGNDVYTYAIPKPSEACTSETGACVLSSDTQGKLTWVMITEPTGIAE